MLKRSFRLLFFGALLLASTRFPGIAQDFDDYQMLRSGTQVPPALQMTLTERIDNQEKREGKELEKRHEQLDQKRFFIGNNYMTDQLFRSGLVFFDDPVGGYLNRIKDYLLRDDEENREQIHVSLVRSAEVNAFATADGDIFVNLGLMAKVPNEATLAFVLCHEIQHVIQRHSFRQFEEVQEIKKRVKKSRKRKEKDLDEFLKAKNLYSRKQELEADELGLQLFVNSAYSSQGIMAAMDLLKYSYLPIAEMEWDTTYFTFSSIRYPSDFRPDSLNPIEMEEHESDEQNTHPNVGTRRSALEVALQKAMEEGKEIGILRVMFGEEEFKQIRETCRFELCHSQLASGDLGDAIWTAVVLQQDHPNSIFLNRCIGHALYRLAKYSSANRKFQALRIARKVQGTSGELHHFLGQMQEFELVVLALKYNWKQHQRFPADPTFTALCEDLARSLVRSYPETLKELEGIPGSLSSRLPTSGKEKDTKIVGASLLPKGTQYIWKRDQKPRDFIVPSLKTEFGQGEFVAILDQALDKHLQASAPAPKIPRHGTARLLHGYELGVGRVVYSPLTFRYVDYRKSIPFQYRKSDEVRSEYTGMVADLAGRLDLDVVMLDYEGAEQENLEDITLLRRWLVDAGKGVEMNGMVNLYQTDALRLAEKYGTNMFAWNTFFQYRDYIPLGNKIGGILISIPMFIMLPYAVYRAFKAWHNSEYTNVVFDITTGEALMIEQRSITKKPRIRMLKSTVYNSLYQIKKEPRR